VGTWAQFTLVLSLQTDTVWIGVSILRLIMKIGNWNCRPLRSAFPSSLVLLAFFGFPVVYWKTNRKIKICAGIVIILVCVTNITANIHLNN